MRPCETFIRFMSRWNSLLWLKTDDIAATDSQAALKAVYVCTTSFAACLNIYDIKTV